MTRILHTVAHFTYNKGPRPSPDGTARGVFNLLDSTHKFNLFFTRTERGSKSVTIKPTKTGACFVAVLY